MGLISGRVTHAEVRPMQQKCKKHQGWKDAPRELAELQYTNPPKQFKQIEK